MPPLVEEQTVMVLFASVKAMYGCPLNTIKALHVVLAML